MAGKYMPGIMEYWKVGIMGKDLSKIEENLQFLLFFGNFKAKK
jgi:hypothetical protein